MFWCNLSDILSVCSPEKMLNFFAWSGDLVDVERVFLWYSKYSVSVMRLVSFYVIQAIWCLKCWNMAKSGGGNCMISVDPQSKFWVSCPRDIRPCRWLCAEYNHVSWHHRYGRYHVHSFCPNSPMEMEEKSHTSSYTPDIQATQQLVIYSQSIWEHFYTVMNTQTAVFRGYTFACIIWALPSPRVNYCLLFC